MNARKRFAELQREYDRLFRRNFELALTVQMLEEKLAVRQGTDVAQKTWTH